MHAHADCAEIADADAPSRLARIATLIRANDRLMKSIRARRPILAALADRARVGPLPPIEATYLAFLLARVAADQSGLAANRVEAREVLRELRELEREAVA